MALNRYPITALKISESVYLYTGAVDFDRTEVTTIGTCRSAILRRTHFRYTTCMSYTCRTFCAVLTLFCIASCSEDSAEFTSQPVLDVQALADSTRVATSDTMSGGQDSNTSTDDIPGLEDADGTEPDGTTTMTDADEADETRRCASHRFRNRH